MPNTYESAPPVVRREIEDHPKPPSASFQIGVGLGMVAAFLLLAFVVGQLESSGAAAPAAATTTAAAAAPATPAAEPAPTAAAPAADAPATPKTEAPAAGDGMTADVKAIQSRLDGLATQIKGIEGKLDALSKPAESNSDSKTISGKVDDLGKSIAAVVPVADKVSQLGGRVDGLDAAVKLVKDEVSGLTAEVKKLTTDAAGDPAIVTGIDLFNAGKYKEAGEVFKKAESTHPNDARVYYYEAFANALTTNDWKGETLSLAAKAAALEKAGTPKRTVIDAAFADLPGTLKPWLAFFRTQTKTP